MSMTTCTQSKPIGMNGAPVASSSGDGKADDYETVRRTIEFVSIAYRGQPSMEEIAEAVGLPPERLEAVFRRWCGLTPKAFLQAVTLDHARRLLDGGASLFDAAYETGLSGPSRLHDLFVKHEAVSPGAYKGKGEGIELAYGFHPTPFGRAIVVASGRGLAGIGFAEAGAKEAAAMLDDMKRRWPKASFVHDAATTAPYVGRAFQPALWRADDPLRIVLIGTDFEVRVWEALLKVPVGSATSYSAVAEAVGAPKAARAVGAAVGRNPISFVVPCHRVVGKTGSLTGYHWGLSRKRAMLGWEAGQLARG